VRTGLNIEYSRLNRKNNQFRGVTTKNGAVLPKPGLDSGFSGNLPWSRPRQVCLASLPRFYMGLRQSCLATQMHGPKAMLRLTTWASSKFSGLMIWMYLGGGAFLVPSSAELVLWTVHIA
jgi:hypothetical protein